jgi:divalent metal cation (Fe/Co/Zn/Cd) transporter
MVNHILSDVVTSVGVIVGLVLAIMFDQPRLDPLLALIVAINVLWQGSKVITSSVGGLDGPGRSIRSMRSAFTRSSRLKRTER